MTGRRIGLVALAVLLAGGTFVVGFDKGWLNQATEGAPSSGAIAAPSSTQVAPQVAQAPAAAPVPVAKPKVQSVSDTMEVTGNAAAVNEVKLLARVVGYLDRIHFEDGA